MTTTPIEETGEYGAPCRGPNSQVAFSPQAAGKVCECLGGYSWADPEKVGAHDECLPMGELPDVDGSCRANSTMSNGRCLCLDGFERLTPTADCTLIPKLVPWWSWGTSALISPEAATAAAAALPAPIDSPAPTLPFVPADAPTEPYDRFWPRTLAVVGLGALAAGAVALLVAGTKKASG